MGDIELQVFADRLKKLRSNRNLTQKDFAEKIGVTAAALSAYENNLKNPSIAVAKRISDTFHVSIDWLCGLTERECYDEDFETYADMFRYISKLCDIPWFFGHWDIIFVDNSDIDDFSRTGINFAMLKCSDKTVVSFFKDWEQMYELHRAGTIDSHLYNLWLSDRIKQYENTPLFPEIADDTSFAQK